MDFAKRQLEKYGWKEGQGLGKEGNQGISTALKPHYKTGKTGMGFDLAEELTDRWWTRAYDDLAKNINIETDETDGSTKVSAIQDPETQSSDAPHIRMNKRLLKANFTEFAKGGTLDNGKVIPEPETDEPSEKPKKEKKKKRKLTDEQLLEACEGRTAHKGARHGFTASAKLARLAAQEEVLLAKMRQAK